MLDGDFSQHGDLQRTKITLKELQENVHATAVSNDGAYVAFTMGNGCVKIYDTTDMKLKQRSPLGVPFDGLPSTGVAWAPSTATEEGHYLLANVSSAGALFAWHWDGSDFLERIIRCPEEKNETSTVEFSPDGAQLFSAGSDRNIRVYDVAERKLTAVLNKGVDDEGHMRAAHSNRIFSLKFLSPTTFISAGWQSPIQVWDLRTGRAERQVAGAHPASNCLAAVHGTTRFMCCSARPNNQLQVFDYIAGREIVEESNKYVEACGKSPITSLSLRPETNTIWAAAQKPDALLQIDASTGALRGTVPSAVQIMAIDSSEHNPNRVFVGGMKETVYVVDAA